MVCKKCGIFFPCKECNKKIVEMETKGYEQMSRKKKKKEEEVKDKKNLGGQNGE